MTGKPAGPGSLPWGAVKEHMEDFIDREYLPDNFPFNNPLRYTIYQCSELLGHWYQQQDEFGPTWAFRWSSFITAQRRTSKAMLKTAVYPTHGDIPESNSGSMGEPIIEDTKQVPQGNGQDSSGNESDQLIDPTLHAISAIKPPTVAQPTTTEQLEPQRTLDMGRSPTT